MRQQVRSFIGVIIGLVGGFGMSLVAQPTAPKESSDKAIADSGSKPMASPARSAATISQAADVAAVVEVSAPESELAAFRDALSNADDQGAYDFLLAAMRTAPGDGKVFDASLDFIEASAKGDGEDLGLAHDVYLRMASLIPFLPIAEIKEARARYVKAGEAIFREDTNAPADSDQPFAETKSLLAAIARTDLPSSARADLLQEIEADLTSQARRAAMSADEQDAFWRGWRSMKERYEEAQKQVLGALYEDDCAKRLRAWVGKVDDFQMRRSGRDRDDDLQDDDLVKENTEIVSLIAEGQGVSRDLTPFLEAAVEAAINDDKENDLAKRLVKLAQLREWNYNRWALNRVEKVEKAGGTTMEKLKSLAQIDDARLSPYVAEQFMRVWKNMFDACSTDDKVEATKLRILQEYE